MPVLLRHTAQALVAVWLTLSALFLLSRSVTDPAAFIQSTLSANTRLDARIDQAALTQQLLRRYGLSAPLFYTSWQPAAGWRWHGTGNQYHQWLGQLLAGNLGISYRQGAPVRGLLGEALRYTLPLTLLATTGSVGLAIGMATSLGYRPRARRLVLLALHGIQSFPLFLVAVGLLLLLANPDTLAWFPAFGLGLEPESGNWGQRAGELLYHLALPVLSLVIVSLPGLVIQLDGAIQQEMTRAYVATARAKGASRRRTMRGHVLRNALLPTIALLTDLLPNLVAGSVVVEVLFALPGMGRLLAEAAATQDYPLLLGAVGLVAVVRLVAQWLTDVAYQLTDPRIRL
ncbi:ABC transporter permease [Hymenobacter rubripertinctus]|uniref:ABC transporter permease n=1 Tax=Hymenobacter rubripertinctus TaxID=2029981 RepID=A0A418QJL1_9BACT|nr:ABC transporter permease [Hymenobacter rubripertinctus]RIY05341.1 ABC transporter permease [Hymenobacter rubripertinctus]